MDEPSSGLDAASEELVFEAIERLIQGKTAIVIAHRLSTVRELITSFLFKTAELSRVGTTNVLWQRVGSTRDSMGFSFAAAR
jgi:ABC-type bacteriocin/lantibiotic exporter with double-glycine peptidase domain